MPQKTIFTKYPLLTVPHCFLSCGLVRTDDPRIQQLYQRTQDYLESPSVWEGAFRLAALLKDEPTAEPVTGRILDALRESEDGSLPGGIEDQTAIARAALVLFEYNTDRGILKRIAEWCRYLEIEWDQLFTTGRTLFSPADLMELLVRFYRAGGIKSVLRLCTRLRSAAFDWTTSLHTIKQVIQLESMEEEQIAFIEHSRADEIDYDQKQILLNHAETLADGIRYSLYAGIFSGNRQDLTAGRTAWKYLQKHYRAICGGTTAGPFLSGAASNARIGTVALGAWAEAFASQMLLPGSGWATDELIRIAFNGLSYCLNAGTLPEAQQVNSIALNNRGAASASLYARIARAAAAVYSHGVTVTETGIRINYPAEAKYILMIQKQPVVLHGDGNRIQFSMKGEVTFPVDVFRAETETAVISMVNSGELTVLNFEKQDSGEGRYLHTENGWRAQDQIRYDQEDEVAAEETHHQGVCWFIRNRLMACECTRENYQIAAGEIPTVTEGCAEAKLYRFEGWHLLHDEPDDIPVLPGRYEGEVTAELVPYDRAGTKIAMFPRINPLCLK